MDIILPSDAAGDQALRVGVDALTAAAIKRGKEFRLAPARGGSPYLLVGDAQRNPDSAHALGARARRLAPIEHPHGFALKPIVKQGLLLYGATPLAETYGLLWLADRLATTGDLPRRATQRSPAFARRYFNSGLPAADLPPPRLVHHERMAAALERAKQHIRHCLAWGASDLLLHRSHSVAPWEDPVEGRRSDLYAPYFAELIDYCHTLGLGAFAYDDEFLYLEQPLRRAGASLSPEDPAMWRVLQDKYRGLLRRFPALDGVATRIGETIPSKPFRAFDLIHNDSTLSLEEKYRRFVIAMHEVVVEEFGKEYYHRLWVTNDYEQHSVPQLFERTFASLPLRNLTICVKLTATDQWWYQALNPNFGRTAHATAVELEMVHGWHGRQQAPDYMGEWFQAGLRYALAHGARAGAMHLPQTRWMEASAYAAMRLLWDPYDDLGKITRDWAARIFGSAAAADVAPMLFLSDDALSKGLYVKPYASTHAWHPCPHLLDGLFVVAGDPLWDEGRGHLAFLRDIYWQCRPFIGGTERELDDGLRIWRRMTRHWQAAQRTIEDPHLAADGRAAMDMGEALIDLNVAYVKSWFRYFQYEEKAHQRRRRAALAALERLDSRAAAYRRAGGDFNLVGIEEFAAAARRGLASAEDAARLAAPCTKEEVPELVKQRMREEAQALNAAPHPVKILEWEALVDGRDEVIVNRDGACEIRHLAGNSASAVRHRFHRPVAPNAQVVVKPIEVRDYAYVVEQPHPENDGRLVFRVDDPEAGCAVYRLELYAVPAHGS